MPFNSLHTHSYYSLLDGLPSPEKVVKRAAKVGMSAIALTDHGGVNGAIQFQKAAEKSGVKPIFGNELYLIEPEFEKTTHLPCWSKNLKGWKQLLKIVAEANSKENFYYKPRISRDQLAQYCDGNLMSCNGHPGSSLANILFTDYAKAYKSKTLQEARSWLKPDALEQAIALAEKYNAIFGAGNFFIEIQIIDHEHFMCASIIAEILREVSKKTGIPCVATADSHYAEPEDYVDQQIILCKGLRTNFNKVQTALDSDEDVSLGAFFRSKNYYIPSPEEMAVLHKGYEAEIENTKLVADMIESYSILSRPKIPRFDCPGGIDQDEYMKQLCREGWKSKIAKKIPKDQHATYADRIKHELDVLLPLNLAGYFLIVQDFIRKAKEDGTLVGKGRGSAAGCLTSYLMGITGIDPIPGGLLFERFFNPGRSTADNVSYPDIDTDFEQAYRPKVIEHARNKYGASNVAAISTYGRLQGRGALKAVLSAYDSCSFDEQNRMTEYIPDEAAISDDLQEMIEEGRGGSILLWALENNPKEMSEWAELRDDGEIVGDYADIFKAAIRIEGCKNAQSKHASGYIISSDPLLEYVPMVRDKSGENLMVGWEGTDAEKAGALKFDILGTSVLDKIHYTLDLVARDGYE